MSIAKLWKILHIGMRPRGHKFHAEGLICFEFANELRALTLASKFNGIWMHVPNEQHSSKIHGWTIRAMGRVPGASDYVFMRPDFSACLEFKSADGVQSDNQKIFQAWCESQHVPYLVVRTCKEGMKALAAWGFVPARLL
jgi:hypothetical protein